MPKPVFREEAVIDIARHAMFLHEVAHPQISFTFVSEEADPVLVCDRRQIGQALTNIVKNAVEAIEQRHVAAASGQSGEEAAKADIHGHIAMAISREDDEIVISVIDDGIGLPVERERIIEPYMTTRVKGTGLGLAIVKKIVEEHYGTMIFGDAESGGTVVTLRFDMARLARLAEDGEERPGDNMKETLNGA
jgi:two-component system nitrogen regulation sensor histidine kinase NtrY